ncbi:hypothetical protein Pyn_26929 [Prunus yedoensis var. nudiflora]|uniref:Uncharacterized protein n=1 Tax=Prunus yedoensis var. nudiflora TaxID=2094558 RepID=A0A314UDY6_PRUYE|nr:hypothetical protein Pyn_26929 [Prunus yedoensis var. nudiflora]
MPSLGKVGQWIIWRWKWSEKLKALARMTCLRRLDSSRAPGLAKCPCSDDVLEKYGEVQGSGFLAMVEVTHVNGGNDKFNKGKQVLLEEVLVLHGDVSLGTKAKGIGRDCRVGGTRPRSSPKKGKGTRKGFLLDKGVGRCLVNSGEQGCPIRDGS